MENTIVTFFGIDNWNRPVFKALDKESYYGSVDIIFDDDASEAEVLEKITEDNMVFLYNNPEDDPMGTKPVGKIIIQRDLDEYDHDATYSPDDNKIRIYPAYRFDKEDYLKLCAAGFQWAPKQEVFFAPKWTPAREDMALHFCGEIGDEDTSLVERAEERAERFEGYSENREKDAKSAQSGVSAIADNIPFGQPILVGHHSEKRARRDAQRIDDGMRKSIKMWKTSEYWTSRAAGAIRSAKYKESAPVRARRIKKIEANVRRLEACYTPNKKHEPVMMKGWNDNDEAMHVLCGKGRGGQWVKQTNLERIKKGYSRWIAHYENRLAYEKAMLEAQGASQLLEKKPRPKQLPLLNYEAPEGISIENIYHRGEFATYPQVKMTKAEYSKVYQDYKGTSTIEKSHRVRTYFRSLGERVVVFLTDSKVHNTPVVES